MKLIRSLTRKNMKSSRSRTLVTILGILLSAAMFTAVTTMGVSLRDYMMSAEIAERGDYFIQYDYGTMEDLENLRQEEAVRELGTVKTIGYAALKTDRKDETFIIGAGDKEFFRMIPAHLTEGRLPETGSELVITGQAQELLEELGRPSEIGGEITLPLSVSCDSGTLELPVSGEPFEKTFTIVGVSEYDQPLGDISLDLSTLLTFDDGSAPGIWGRFFVKTAPREAAAFSEKQFGSAWSVNQNLLNFYGQTKYHSINDLIVTFAAVLMVIILAGSASLIYNAFSISVSERTRQFGLLSSVGATRKQIRKCVFTEALYLSVIGIPLGLLTGFGGIALTLHLTHGLIDDMLWTAAKNGIVLRAVPSVPAFLIAAAVALLAVLISAWIPARRAAKVTPMEAIRRTKEFKVPKRGIRAGNRIRKVFGVPAALARKYDTVSRKKYRATVISLTISMVLFVSAGTFVQQLTTGMEDQMNNENFDFAISVSSPEEAEKIRTNSAVKDSSLIRRDYAWASIPEDRFTDGYREAWKKAAEEWNDSGTIDSRNVDIYYVEDRVLTGFLREQGINPEPYLDSGDPAALVPAARLTVYERDEKGRITDRERLIEPILKESADPVVVVPESVPQGVLDRLERITNVGIHSESGVLLMSVEVPPEESDAGAGSQRVEIEIRPLEDGTGCAYYIRDPETGEPEAGPADVVTLPRTRLRIGKSIRELPLGVRQTTDPHGIALILPLSAAPQGPQDGCLNLMVTAADYDALTEFLNDSELAYTDYLGSQMQYRDYVTMLRIFSYGFITLISLICICNVFNTISTNIALRRKDFGMLRSLGMKNRQIRRMVSFECLQYGLRALLWGVPLSLIFSFLISGTVGISAPAVPWKALVISAGCIFLTVFITMFYAVSKLRKQNPMEAIRLED